MRRWRFLLLFTILITHCTSQKFPESNLPQYGGTIKIRRLASLENLDPHTLMFKTDLNTASLTYEGLTRFGVEPDQVEPCLAESWSVENEGKRLNFQLRPDVYFHDNRCFPNGEGRRLTADDVVFSFHRMADQTTKSPNYYLLAGKIQGIDAYHTGVADSISGIRKTGDLTLEIRLTRALVSFPKLLATTIGCIMPREAVELYGENISKNPVGTGPFRLVQWRHLEGLSLARHEKYWDRSESGQTLPYLDGIEVRLISNPVQSVTELLKGDLDLLSLKKDRYDQLESEGLSAESFKVSVSFDYGIRFFGFAMDKPFWRDCDPLVRQAIALSMDRSKINVAMLESDLVAKTLVPKVLLPDRQFTWYPYDLHLARQTIASASSPPERPIVITANIETRETDLLANGLSSIDIEPDVQIHQVGYYRYVFKERPDLFRVSFQPSYPDAEDYYALFYSKNTKDSNITGYKNPEYDRLFEHALNQDDLEARRTLFLRMESILKEDVPVIYLCHPPNSYHVMRKDLHGFSIRFSKPDYARVWIEASQYNNESQN